MTSAPGPPGPRVAVRWGEMIANALGTFSLSVFILSAVAHVSTFVPCIPVSMSLVWPLHLAAMATGVVLIIVSSIRWNLSTDKRLNQLSNRMSFVTKNVRFIYWTIIVYFIINFIVSFVSLEGVPEEEHGRYYIHQHKKIIRYIEEDEYRRCQAYVVRRFSGHWMLFSMIATSCCFYRFPEIRSRTVRTGKSNTSEVTGPSTGSDWHH